MNTTTLIVVLAAVAAFAVLAWHYDGKASRDLHPCGCAWPDEDDDCPALIVCEHGHAYLFRAWTDRAGRLRDAWDEATVVRGLGGALTIVPMSPATGVDPDPVPGRLLCTTRGRVALLAA